MVRPAGITTIAVLCLLVSVGWTLYAIRLIATGNFPTSVESICDIVISIGLNALACWGLLKLKNWARILIIVALAVGCIHELIQFSQLDRSTVFSFLSSSLTDLGYLLLFGAATAYLFKTEVKSAFGKQ